MDAKYCKYRLSNRKPCSTDITGSVLSMCMPHFIMTHTKVSDKHTLCSFPVEHEGKWKFCDSPRIEGDTFCPEHTEQSSNTCIIKQFDGTRCKYDVEINSKYCTYHSLSDTRDKDGCVLVYYSKQAKVERCCAKVWHKKSRYCRNHYFIGPDEGLGKPKGCPVMIGDKPCDKPCPEDGKCIIHTLYL